MPPKRILKSKKDESEDEENAFSNSEDNESNSGSTSGSDSDHDRMKRKKKKSSKKRRSSNKKRKRAQSESNESSAEESSEDERKSKKKKKQSKKVKSEDDDEDLEKLPKKKSKSAFKHPFPELMTIETLSDEKMKNWKHKTHKCALGNVKMNKPISGNELCRPGRPAELPYARVKLHYIIHYINRGLWDHIIPEEDPIETERKIESYTCQVCNKVCKNNLEKLEFPGRSTALCHLATDHGRLLKAMIEDTEVNMFEEIQKLAEWDKKFNETYKNFIEKDDDGYVVKDEEAIKSKESIFWKMYAKKRAEKAEKEKEKKAQQKEFEKHDAEENKKNEEKLKAVEARFREKPKHLKCQFCNEKPRSINEAGSFRFHFFSHYKDNLNEWDDRIANLEKDKLAYYCDICRPKKLLKGASDEGAIKSTICHLAIQHHELRKLLDKDDRLSEDYIKDIYWDVDLKKAEEDFKNNGYKFRENDDLEKLPTAKKSDPPTAKVESPKKATVTKNKPGPKSKTKISEEGQEDSAVKKNKPGPKSKKDTKSQEIRDAIADVYGYDMNDEDDSDQEAIPDFDEKNSAKKKKTMGPKSKTSGGNGSSIKKKPEVRKRKPVNISMDDLESDGSSIDGDLKSTPTVTKGDRPKRSVSAKKKPIIDNNSDSD